MLRKNVHTSNEDVESSTPILPESSLPLPTPSSPIPEPTLTQPPAPSRDQISSVPQSSVGIRHRETNPTNIKETQAQFSPIANFIPREFIYNTRVFFVLLPCLSLILYLAGKVSIAFLLCGLIAAYICDSFSIKEGSFMSLWLTLLFVFVSLVVSTGFLVRHSVFNLFFLFLCGMILLTTGLWINMQFHWFQELFPAFVLAMERIVMSSLFFPPAIITTWAITIPMGLSIAPYFLLLSLYTTYTLFLLPLPSSFKPAKDSGNICGKFESLIGTIIFLLFPSFFYISIYHRVILEKTEHLTSLGLVFSLSFLALRSISSKNPFWWWSSSGGQLALLGTAGKQQLTEDWTQWKTIRIGTMICIGLFVGCFEQRVIFHSFRHLILIEEPWSEIFVTLGCYSVVSLLYYHFTTGISLEENEVVSSERRRVCYFLGVVASISLSLVIGVPPYLCFIPAYGSIRAITFYFDRKLSDYIFFAGCLSLTMLWYIIRNFWMIPLRPYTPINFTALVASIWGLGVVCTFAPSFVLLKQRLPSVFALSLTAMAVCLTVVEFVMRIWKIAGTDTYPAYLVIFTSLLGIFIVERLEKLNEISELSGLIIVSIFIGKIFILHGKDLYFYFSGLFLTLATLPLFYFYKDGLLTKQRAIFHMSSIFGVSIVSSTFLWKGVLSHFLSEPPTYAQLIGISVLYVSLIGLYTGIRFFSHSSGRALLSKISIMAIVTSCLLLFISPKFTLSTSSVDLFLHGHSSSLLHQSKQNSDGEQHSHISDWLFLSGILLCSSFALNLQSFEKRSATIKLFFCCLLGMIIGFYISMTYVPLYSSSLVLCVWFTCIFVFGFTFIMFVQYPSPYVEPFLPSIYGGFLLLLPIVYILSGQFFRFLAVYHIQESLSRSRIVLLGSYAAMNAFIALFLNITVSPPPTTRRARSMNENHTGIQTTTKVGQNIIGWKNEVGNIATITTFILSLILNIEYLSGSDSSIFFLSPILLLLNKDRHLFKNLSDNNRYYPVYISVVCFLFLSSLYNLFGRDLLLQFGLISSLGSNIDSSTSFFFSHVDERHSYWFFQKNILILLSLIPSHYYLSSFLYNFQKQQQTSYLIYFIPLSAFALFSDLLNLQILGLISLFGAVVQRYISHNITKHGLKAI